MPDRPDWTQPDLQTLQVQVLASLNNPVFASQAGTAATLVAAVANRRIVLLALEVAPQRNAGADTTVRDYVTVEASDATTFDVIARTAISPASPHGSAHILAGAAACGTNHALRVVCQTRSGSGTQSIIVDAWYYLAA